MKPMSIFQDMRYVYISILYFTINVQIEEISLIQVFFEHNESFMLALTTNLFTHNPLIYTKNSMLNDYNRL